MKTISGGVTAPKGFHAAGVYCGVKASHAGDVTPAVPTTRGKPDLAMILSDCECTAAATYTLNRVKAAPLYVTMSHLEDGVCRGVVANSGNANACAPLSHENAEKMCELAAAATGLQPEDFVVASTGVIGQTLNIAAIEKGMPQVVQQLSEEGSDAAAHAIMTTDTVKKELALTVTIGGKPVTIGAIAKGSGMIHPNMGTLLCFTPTACAHTPGPPLHPPAGHGRRPQQQHQQLHGHRLRAPHGHAQAHLARVPPFHILIAQKKHPFPHGYFTICKGGASHAALTFPSCPSSPGRWHSGPPGCPCWRWPTW